MKRILILIIFWNLSYKEVWSQPQQAVNSSEILLSLEKLKTLGSVLYIAAHPDDENTRLLAFLSREKKLRTGYLSITRGDGGQNLIGKEQGDALGVIRTNELLAARNIDGAEQFFTRANDFGYSKTSEETFKFWNKDSVLSDVVWVIRNFKPDVIICRFPATGEGGHGHHTASAILALEAFDAAGDPGKFPEQLNWVDLWKPERIFWNTFNFGSANTTSPDQLKIDVGVYNPLIGKSYGEIAAESRTMHKSQGFGSAKSRGANIEYFKQLNGDSVKSDLFEGMDNSWSRLKLKDDIDSIIQNCILKFDHFHPESTVKDLITIYKKIKDLDGKNGNARYWKDLKLKESEQLILNCSGLWLEASANDYIGIPGSMVEINAQAILRNHGNVKLAKVKYFDRTDTLPNQILPHNNLISFKRKGVIPENTTYSNPYWLNEKHPTGVFNVKERSLIGRPGNINNLNIIYELEIEGLILKVERPLTHKYTDPEKGEIYRPFEVIPPATVNLSEGVYIFPDKNSKPIEFIIKSNAANIEGTLEVTSEVGWTVKLNENKFSFKLKGEEKIIAGTISPYNSTSPGIVKAGLRINGKYYPYALKRIEYDHIPYQFILNEAEAKLIPVDLKRESVKIGYIPGAGDEIPGCLKQIGYDVTILDDGVLSDADLSKYKAIVTGIRAYNTNERLQVHYEKLMRYINEGGNLIVQYNTNNRIGPLLAKIGPYPFSITRERVTDEQSELRFINKEHAAVNFPNKIGLEDFDNWIQERGIYFANDLDRNFNSIISMNDKNEKPLDGSLIISKYGKGNFVYTGLAFFRELPAGVPGAYRLFVNLLSLPAN